MIGQVSPGLTRGGKPEGRGVALLLPCTFNDTCRLAGCHFPSKNSDLRLCKTGCLLWRAFECSINIWLKKSLHRFCSGCWEVWFCCEGSSGSGLPVFFRNVSAVYLVASLHEILQLSVSAGGPAWAFWAGYQTPALKEDKQPLDQPLERAPHRQGGSAWDADGRGVTRMTYVPN